MLKRWLSYIGVAIVFLSIGFSIGTILFVRDAVNSAVKTVVANGSLDTHVFVEKYTPLLDKLKIPYPEGVYILEEVFVWSKFYKVDPDSIIVLLYVESGLDPSATGKYDEIGLFQLQYSTALIYYPNALMSPLDLYDVHNNVVCGIAHWKACLKDARGSYDLARRYYNGGYRYAFIDQVTKYVQMHHGASRAVRKIIING